MLMSLSALAETNRFEIVEFLRSGPRSVGEIVKKLELQQPQVSKHLHVLCEAGIVEKLQVAQRRIYSLRAEPFEELGGWVASFKGLWEERMDSLGSFLEEEQSGTARGRQPQGRKK